MTNKGWYATVATNQPTTLDKMWLTVNFLREIKLAWNQSFLSPRLVAKKKKKLMRPVCSIIYL